MRGVLLLALMLAPISGRAADPSALWKIVNGQCVPHEESEHSPSPCAAVDITNGVEKGFAVLKDKNGIAQFLLIPTARIGGIEDPALLAPGETNYWEAAWQARSFVEQRLHASLPREFAVAGDKLRERPHSGSIAYPYRLHPSRCSRYPGR